MEKTLDGLDGCVVRSNPDIDNPLFSYFKNNKKRCVFKWLHYFDVYHNHFRRFRNKPVSVLEIGVWKGGSLQMWREYFGPKSKIYGIDIDPKNAFSEEGIKIFTGDQSDSSFLKKVISEVGAFDVIIDDGSHVSNHQIASFEKLYSAMSDTGVYLVEDVHCSYFSEYGGGYNNPNSFLEYSKKMIDCLNLWFLKHNDNQGGMEERSLTDNMVTLTTTGIHFYDSMVVFERCPRSKKPCSMQIGK